MRIYDDPQKFAIDFTKKRARQTPIPWRMSAGTYTHLLHIMVELKEATDQRDADAAHAAVEEIRALPGFPNDAVDELGMQGCVVPQVEKSAILSDGGARKAAKEIIN